jgi:hypothetical protein
MNIDLADLNQKELHGLFAGAIVPRPVALVSTIGEDDVFNPEYPSDVDELKKVRLSPVKSHQKPSLSEEARASANGRLWSAQGFF